MSVRHKLLMFLKLVIIIKTKVLLPHASIGNISRFSLFCLGSLVFLLSDFHYPV